MSPAAAAAAAREHDKKLLYFAGGAFVVIAVTTAFASIAIMRSALQNVNKHRRNRVQYTLQAADLQPLGHRQDAAVQHPNKIPALSASVASSGKQHKEAAARKAARKAVERKRSTKKKHRATTKKAKKPAATHRKAAKTAKISGNSKKRSKKPTTPEPEEQEEEDEKDDEEIDMKSSEIIRMDGNKTCIENLKVSPQGGAEELGRERIKEFTFDYSYWSVHPSDAHFVTQEQVFNDLGQEVVDNAFEGYNACIFAYGQTGSGKTFTMMGSSNNEGLIPRICQAMYTRMKLGQNSGTTFRTEVSYLEIYNEKVKDLLKRESTQHNLRVREHPKLGPYVQDLSRHLVMDYSDVEELMARGNSHRQNLFVTSLVKQSAKVNLVDLAGSERADSTKATGQRLKEGGHINKSLVTLGTVISALAELSTSNSRKRVFIPYRDSVLTWLLRDSLGGNSKTIMIATISPAECNYGETLSTLRYANRAKNIINKPTINEDPNVKLIKELREEIARLRSRVGGDDSSTQVMEKLQENEARVKFLTEEWTEKWKETHKILKEQKTLGLRMSGQGVVLDSERPHLIGLGDDILSTGVVLYHLKDGKTFIGTENADTKQDIVLSGPGIQDEHCSIELVDGGATLYPNQNSECCINTMPVDKPTRLTQGCVVLLGTTNVFRYNDPAEVHKLRKEKERRSLMNLSHLSFLSRSAGDMSKSTESICGNGFEAHEDGSENIMDLSMRKLLEKQSGNHDERNNNGSTVAPLSKEQEAVEAQLSQKREELRQLQEKTEELKRMAD
ncbi:hypothetical protein HPB51_006708 [Rhipicephalus microplus]|uniref:Kinesin-like protein n=1 Tax=Rhipicephalus microplus TaxID=6941 RepID=A0A9J6E7S7_RHIMP|nr:hypothetical protein HPB51_006708 [Rhipicephalus microplus]